MEKYMYINVSFVASPQQRLLSHVQLCQEMVNVYPASTPSSVAASSGDSKRPSKLSKKQSQSFMGNILGPAFAKSGSQDLNTLDEQ